MSGSSRSTAFHVTSNPVVEITIYDDARSECGRGTGTVRLSLPPGLYRVHFERAGVVRRELVDHDGNTELSCPGPPMYSPAPLVGAAMSHAYYQDAARELSVADTGPPLGAGPHTSRLFLFLRRAGRELGPGWIPSEPVTIHDVDGRPIAALSEDTAKLDRGDGYVALSCAAAPGTYRIRAGRSRRDVAITIPEGRAAHVFVADNGTVRLDDLRVALVPRDARFEPASPVAIAMEDVIAALRAPRKTFPDAARALLPDAAELDLGFGIAAAHLLWRCQDRTTFAAVMERLGRHRQLPDVVVLAMLLEGASSKPPARLEAPPLLRASLLAAMTRPEVACEIPPRCAFAQAARTGLQDSIWCTWSARPWDERWIVPTIERLRDGGRSRDAASIARSVALPLRTVEEALAELEAALPGGLEHRLRDEGIAGYALEELLGRGAQGAVFRARRPDGAQVALRVIPLADPARCRLVRARLDALLRIEGPAVLHWPAHGLLAGDAGIWIEMELFRGSVLDLLSETDAPLSWPEALRIGVDAAAALGTLHRAGVVHGDIKPSNLLLREGGGVVIADLGLAACLSDPWTPPDARSTPRFVAPELLAGGPPRPTSDVWSLAATLYFLLTLELPREEHAGQSPLEAARRNPIVPLRARRPDIPGAIGRCIDRALSPLLDRRPRDARTFREALVRAEARARIGDDDEEGERAKARALEEERHVHGMPLPMALRHLEELALSRSVPTRRRPKWKRILSPALIAAAFAALFLRGSLIENRCEDLVAQQLWEQACAVCSSEARAGYPHAGPHAARALFHSGRATEALAEVGRWFGSTADASARQVAKEIFLLVRDDSWPETGLLRKALAEQLRRGEHGRAASTGRRLATALMKASELTEALDAAELAVREAELTLDERLQGHALLAQGVLLTWIGDLARARSALLDAQVRLIRWPADHARAQLQFGILARVSGDEAGSVEILTRVLDLAAEPDADAERAARYQRAAPVLEPSNALEHLYAGGHYAHARPYPAAMGTTPLESVAGAARLHLSRAECQRRRPEAAEAHLAALTPFATAEPAVKLAAGLIAADRGSLAEAERLLDEADARLAVPSSLEDRDLAIDLAVERGRLAERAGNPAAAEAFYRRAIAIVEELRRDTKSLELRPWVLASRRAPYEALVSLLAHADRRFDALEIAEHLHARTLLDARAERERAKAQAPDLERRLRGPAAAPALRASELHSLMQDREILVFSQAGTTIWRFHIVNGEIASLDRLPHDALDLAESWRPSDARQAEVLGDRLVPPAARAPSSRPLYIVSSGVLAEQPFAALRPGGRYLVETRATIRIPGLAALQCQSGEPAAQEAVFIADSMWDLPGARQEAVTLAKQRGQRAYLGWEATFARLETARDATLLHVAVHGDNSSQGSVLRLAGRDATAADILERRIAPRVAVLSGSWTAASRDDEGWGALSSAFLAAGSESVVATLSSVPDAASLELMQRFYEAGGERRPAEALAAAQREMIALAVPRRDHLTTAWSAFVVDGAGPACEAGP